MAGGTDICDEFERADVQDEKHALFYCNCLEACVSCAQNTRIFVLVFPSLKFFEHYLARSGYRPLRLRSATLVGGYSDVTLPYQLV
eukprot:1145694-Pelagomonas_calceolata.AAC.5